MKENTIYLIEKNNMDITKGILINSSLLVLGFQDGTLEILDFPKCTELK